MWECAFDHPADLGLPREEVNGVRRTASCAARTAMNQFVGNRKPDLRKREQQIVYIMI
jgi:hypothetical protein